MNTDKTLAEQVGERGDSDYQSLTTALIILESISEIVLDLPASSKGGTDINGKCIDIDIDYIADHKKLQNYIVNAIDDTINVTHEEMTHMVNVEFREKAHWGIQYINWQDPSVGQTYIAMGNFDSIEGSSLIK